MSSADGAGPGARGPREPTGLRVASSASVDGLPPGGRAPRASRPDGRRRADGPDPAPDAQPQDLRRHAPAPMEPRIFRRIAGDVRANGGSGRAAPCPRGALASAGLTPPIISDPLRLLLEHERRFGPVFTIRLLHEPIVWAIGAEVNHQIGQRLRRVLVAGGPVCGPVAAAGRRDAEHRRPLPPRVPDADAALPSRLRRGLAETMIEEALAASRAACRGPGGRDLPWVRELALRIALRGLLGLEVTGGREQPIARAFEASLAIHGEPVRSCCCRRRGGRWLGRSRLANGSMRSSVRDRRAAAAGGSGGGARPLARRHR